MCAVRYTACVLVQTSEPGSMLSSIQAMLREECKASGSLPLLMMMLCLSPKCVRLQMLSAPAMSEAASGGRMGGSGFSGAR